MERVARMPWQTVGLALVFNAFASTICKNGYPEHTHIQRRAHPNLGFTSVRNKIAAAALPLDPDQPPLGVLAK